MIPEGWSKCSLGKYIAIKHGYAFKSDFFSNSGRYILLTPGSFYEPGGFRDQGDKTKYYNNSFPSDYLLKKGDLLIAMTEQAEGLLGSALFVPEDEKYLHNQRLGLVSVIDRESMCSEFLYFVFNSIYVRKQISEQASGTKVKHTSPDRLRSVVGLIPPLYEQRKIAQILSTWDEAITNSVRLIEASQQQRRALMQQLLTGKRRLPGFTLQPGLRREKYGTVPNDWDFAEIGSFARQFSKKNVDSEELPVLSCSKYSGFVDSLSYFNKRVYSENLSGYKVIYRGDIGFPSNHVEEGSIGLQDLYEKGLVSPIYVVFRLNEKKADPEFVFRLLKMDHYRQVFAASTNASVDRRGSLRWKEFSAIKVSLPSLHEQKAIVLALKTADAEIEAQQQHLDCLRQEKKALMQKLLTGKRRVKARDEAA